MQNPVATFKSPSGQSPGATLKARHPQVDNDPDCEDVAVSSDFEDVCPLQTSCDDVCCVCAVLVAVLCVVCRVSCVVCRVLRAV